MPNLSRRHCLQTLGLTLSAAALPRVLHAADEPVRPEKGERDAIAAIAKAFMEKYEVPGLSVAFAHREKPAYSVGFGMADVDANEAMAPVHRFRIASVSKPITSVALFTLVEQGKLKLSDKVLGEGGILHEDYGKDAPPDVASITIHHLLTHTCGGWGNNKSDPMFEHKNLDHHDLIVRTLKDHPLEHAPGTNYSYSNFGYCLLGRTIEKLTGKTYAQFVENSVLAKSGITDMKIAGDTREQRIENEVVYYGRSGENPYGMNIRRMDSHGGWLASPSDLVEFLIHTANSGAGNVLRDETVKTMLTAGPPNPGYACGWCVNPVPNRWHNGSLPGTSTIAVRTASGMCWAGFTNARGEGIDGALDRMMWDMAKAVPAWKA
ncbi:serine hydrolase domain-containing protein [Haloferula sp. BvORR071]|uniref:serine hydrolase domain-containing protein n=1 Tax=Haloferula sp. BvORR071 TaxID=1396141 RepID=UPI000699171A|nr:serine hydrolase domain-containing protein [Haloferula sp. BvORR071]